MNLYKDLYKKANNNIPTDDAKMRVMQKLQSPAKVRPVRHFTEFAALAACLIFTFAAVGIYHNFEKSREEQLLEMALPQATQVSEENPIPDEISTSDEIVVTPAPKEAENKVTAAPRATTQPAQVAKVETRSVAETPAAVVADTSKTDVTEPATKTQIFVNESTEGQQDDLSPAAFTMDRSVGRIEEVTIEEYYQYLGKNVEADAVLPDGFSLTREDSAMFELADSGEYKDDRWYFVYENNEKSVEIITSKNMDTISKILADEGYEKSKISNTDAVVIKENDLYKSYIAADSVGYTITSFGILEEELENLLVSLAE